MTDNLRSLVERLAEVRAFLHGAGPLDGHWFGDQPANERGAFWWRKRIGALDEAAQAISDLLEENSWRPIESAPKDGEFLVAAADGRILVMSGFILGLQDERTPGHLQFPATHWRPLPSPPHSDGVE